MEIRKITIQSQSQAKKEKVCETAIPPKKTGCHSGHFLLHRKYKRIAVHTSWSTNRSPYLTNNQSKRSWGHGSRQVECLPGKCMALSSNSSTDKKNIKGKRVAGGGVIIAEVVEHLLSI
jgi:hypothetical protein